MTTTEMELTRILQQYGVYYIVEERGRLRIKMPLTKEAEIVAAIKPLGYGISRFDQQIVDEMAYEDDAIRIYCTLINNGND